MAVVMRRVHVIAAQAHCSFDRLIFPDLHRFYVPGIRPDQRETNRRRIAASGEGRATAWREGELTLTSSWSFNPPAECAPALLWCYSYTAALTQVSSWSVYTIGRKPNHARKCAGIDNPMHMHVRAVALCTGYSRESREHSVIYPRRPGLALFNFDFGPTPMADPRWYSVAHEQMLPTDGALCSGRLHVGDRDVLHSEPRDV